MNLDIEDFETLRRYLAQHTNQGHPVSFTKLLGGVSNRTVRVMWPDGTGWVLKQALTKLRVNVDWFSSPDRIQVEAKALRWLNRLAPPGTTPSFILEDKTNDLLAMEAIPEEHESWKAVLLAGHIIPQQFEQFGRMLGAIHRESARSEWDLAHVFGDTTYFESLRLEPYYLYTATQTPAAADFLRALAQETLRQKLSLVHGDFSPKNTLLYQGRLILLDYEVAHFGDAAFDVGFALSHFLSKAHHLSRDRKHLPSAAGLFFRVYFGMVASLGWDALEPRAIRHTLACLLARVAGKSPLEYLTSVERARQQEVVLQLMRNPPLRVDDLIAQFIEEIEAHA
jgi:aminoglycoside phosphotransferase (APT) family kinase protein